VGKKKPIFASCRRRRRRRFERKEKKDCGGEKYTGNQPPPLLGIIDRYMEGGVLLPWVSLIYLSLYDTVLQGNKLS